MQLPRLRCPIDASHEEFRGRVSSHANYVVTLDADRLILRRGDELDTVDRSEPSDDDIFCTACGVQVWSRPRAITFFPADGTVLICDFSGGFRPPEMIERRPIVVISPKNANRRTCIVVPISSRQSRDGNAITVPMLMSKYRFLRKDGWAKCHAPATVSVTRLFMMRDPLTGRGIDTRSTMLDPGDLAAVRRGVARFTCAIGESS